MLDFGSLGLGTLLVVFARLAIPFSILRWPLAGGVASVLADTLDVVVITFLDARAPESFYFRNYTEVDKALDMYFLWFMALSAFQWADYLARYVGLHLFFYRLVGVLALELTGKRELLFVFPNVFMWFFFFWVLRNRYFPWFELTWRRLFVVLGIMVPLKEAHEYFLHIYRAQPWIWIMDNVIRK